MFARKWLRHVSVTLVGVALLIQIAAVSSPGWLIDFSRNTETYASLFYRIKCYSLANVRDCSTRSYRNLHEEERQDANISRKAVIVLDAEYHRLVWKETVLCAAIVTTLVLFVILVAQHRKEEAITLPRLTFLGGLLSALGDGLATAVTCLDIVNVAYKGRLYDTDSLRDHTYIWVSYSVALMLGSVCVLLLAKAILIVAIFKGPKTVKKMKEHIADADEWPKNQGKTKPVFTNVGINPVPAEDAPAYEEKL